MTAKYTKKTRSNKIPPRLEKAKADSPEAVILLMVPKSRRYRYEYGGGFTVLFVLSKGEVQPWEIFVPDRWA